MKLISLYIENFGGLREFSMNFSDGLNVLAQPNGFGKTTLAEFIRAMLYGFPRKNKVLEKDLRRKYAPWQGGGYGGNLVFETGGVRYRVERKFGAVPREDTFALFDLTDNRCSGRFSEELGRELFGMDGESFARSTYLSQLDHTQMGTTADIQAKLTNLADDAADMARFPRAYEAMKNARSGLIPYRGSGGAVAEAQRNAARIREQLGQLQPLEPEEETLREEIGRRERTLAQLKLQLRDLRSKIHTAAENGQLQAVRQEYDRLIRQQEQLQLRQDALLSGYPGGIPSGEELETAREAAKEAALLEKLIVTTPDDLEAAAFLREQEPRFARGVPTEEELAAREEELRQYETLCAEESRAGLSPEDLESLHTLRQRHAAGKLEEAYLLGLENAYAELEKARDGLRAMRTDGAESSDPEGCFARGVPTEAELHACRDALTEAERLRRKKQELTEQLAGLPKAGRKTGEIALWILSAVAVAVGIMLLLSRVPVWSWVSLGLGASALVAAVICRRLRRPGEPDRDTLLGQIEELQRQILCQDQAARELIRKYYDGDTTMETLYEIFAKRENYLAARLRREKENNLRLELERIAEERAAMLTRELGTGDFLQALRGLRLDQSRLAQLEQRASLSGEKTDRASRELETLRQSIGGFLKIYYPHAEPERFGSLLAALGKDARRYIQCRERVRVWQRRKEMHEQKKKQTARVLEEFCCRYGLEHRGDMSRRILEIRDDARDYDALCRSIRTAAEEREAFCAAHAAELACPAPEEADLRMLQTRETELAAEAETHTDALAQLRQRQSHIAGMLSEIPELRRELERWSTAERERRAQAAVLDASMDYLERARDNLRTGYLAPLRDRFTRYLAWITGERPEDIVVTPELEISLMRVGAAREVGYFSAGQTDTLMLCMRFALVDALFTGEQPFVILDDPFVNLDDAHTAQAIAVLQKLAKEKQILYMTCNTSRVPE